ncbi:MAG: hypothetical protein HN712_25795 [Gemmatimonadetes bacterium]|jgi:glucose-6-phosphate isomerase|nr:hypothetical protein [Gemmatimonadota bacterium]
MALQRQDITAGTLTDALETALEQMRRDRIVSRILDRDHTVWKPDPTEISNRLGWLDSPATLTAELDSIKAFVQEVRNEGFTHALLLGMGGSSLAPEVFRRIFGAASGHLDLRVLDSTDPSAVKAAFDASPAATTLYLPATKSGGTVETLSFLKYGYQHARQSLGAEAGRSFAAITDPGSGLADLAAELNFRHIFLNDPDIGGRYSALSMFGIVPAALCGVDVAALLAAGQTAVDELTQLDVDAPSVLLGALLGVGARHGRDKLTLRATPSLAPFGVWIEQLIAESTGKEGHGILPVEGEPVGEPQEYSEDRLFVESRLATDAEDTESEGSEIGAAGPTGAGAGTRATLDQLSQAGHPAARILVETPTDLGAEMVRWEIATIVASHLLQINPFDQPDVESAKIQARAMVSSYQETGELPSTQISFSEGPVDASGDVTGKSLVELWQGVLSSSTTSYIALQAYLPPSQDTDDALLLLRRHLRDATMKATTSGYGPRFLHSTGQLHKGDGGKGLFIQLTCDDENDVPIPDDAGSGSQVAGAQVDGSQVAASTMDFGVLKAAQALGDAQALRQGSRTVIRLHMRGSISAALQRLTQTLETSIN